MTTLTSKQSAMLRKQWEMTAPLDEDEIKILRSARLLINFGMVSGVRNLASQLKISRIDAEKYLFVLRAMNTNFEEEVKTNE